VYFLNYTAVFPGSSTAFIGFPEGLAQAARCRWEGVPRGSEEGVVSRSTWFWLVAGVVVLVALLVVVVLFGGGSGPNTGGGY
jgi:hypothetical protein